MINNKLIKLSIVALGLSLVAGCNGSNEQNTESKPIVSFEKQVEKALVNNPQILKNAIEALQKHDQLEQLNVDAENINKNYNMIFNRTEDPTIGSDDPTLVIAYFTDPNCGYCKRFDPVLNQVMRDFPKLAVKIKFVPILGKSSQRATKFAFTVWENEPQKFKTLKNIFMTNPTKLDNVTILKAAEKTDTVQHLNTSISNTTESVNKTIGINMLLLQELKITGTPTLVVGDQIIRGSMPYEQLNALIKSEIQLVVER